MKRIALLVGLLIPLWVAAQKNTVLYNMRNVPQSVYLNPATIPTSRLNIAIPALGGNYLSLNRSDFETQDIVFENENGDLDFDTRKFVLGLEEENSVQLNSNFDFLHVGFASGQNYFHFNVTERLEFDFEFPREAAILLEEVYASDALAIVGQNVLIEDMQVNGYHIREYGFGWGRSVNEKLTVGAKAKLLYGVSTIETRSTALYVDTQVQLSRLEEEEISAFAQYDIRTSGVDEYGGGSEGLLFGNNNFGFAMDLGASYKVNDKLSFSGSVLDLFGSVRWNDNNLNYLNEGDSIVINPIQAVDVFSTGTDSSIIDVFDQFLDSLSQELTDTVQGEAFTSSIPMRLNLAATVQLSSRTQLTLFNQNIFGDNDQFLLKALLQTRVKRFLNASIAYAIVDETESPLNLGLGLSLNLGFLQFYVASENVLAPISLDDNRNPTVMLGFNITLNRDYE